MSFIESPRSNAPLPLQGFHSETLPNGWVMRTGIFHEIPVFLIETHGPAVAQVQVWVRAGSATEKQDPEFNQSGLAHLFEHLMFRGTLNNPDGEYDRKMVEWGARETNATTWLDRTQYLSQVPVSALSDVLEMEADRLTAVHLSEEVFQKEREAVLSEYKMTRDDPVQVGMEILYRAAFGEQSYGASVIGKEEDIKSFTLEQALRFYRKYYSASSLALWICGGFKSEEVFPLVKQKFLQKFENPASAPFSTPSMQPHRSVTPVIEEAPLIYRGAGHSEMITHGLLTEPRLLLSFPVPTRQSERSILFAIVDYLLCEGETSVLNRLWVLNQKCTQVTGSLDGFKKGGLYTLFVDLFPTSVELKAEESVHQFDEDRSNQRWKSEWSNVILNLRSWDSNQWRNHLLRAVRHWKLNWVRQWDQFDELSQRMGEIWIATHDAQYEFKEFQKVESLDFQNQDELVLEWKAKVLELFEAELSWESSIRIWMIPESDLHT